MSQNGIIVGVIVSICASVAIAGVVLGHIFRKKPKKKHLMGNNVKVPIRLIDREMVTSDTMSLKFALPTPQHVLGLPIGNHVYIKVTINGQSVIRPYTPINLHNEGGYVDFIIKVYQANEQFPNGGKMSLYLSELKLESYIDISGPAGDLEYKGCGLFHIKSNTHTDPKPFNAKYVNMICGGTGITPMYQILCYILSSNKDETSVSLLFANNTHEIVLFSPLEILEKENERFRLWFTISQEHVQDWEYSVGHVDEKMMKDHLFPPSEDTLTLICGPPPMIELACYPNLAKLNYKREHIFAF